MTFSAFLAVSITARDRSGVAKLLTLYYSLQTNFIHCHLLANFRQKRNEKVYYTHASLFIHTIELRTPVYTWILCASCSLGPVRPGAARQRIHPPDVRDRMPRVSMRKYCGAWRVVPWHFARDSAREFATLKITENDVKK